MLTITASAERSMDMDMKQAPDPIIEGLDLSSLTLISKN